MIIETILAVIATLVALWCVRRAWADGYPVLAAVHLVMAAPMAYVTYMFATL